MQTTHSDDIPLRHQRLARLAPLGVLLIGLWISYENWWHSTYLRENTTIWICRLNNRSLVDPPRFHYGSQEFGICGATANDLRGQQGDIYVRAYRGEQGTKTWEPTWLDSGESQVSAFETTVPELAYLGGGHYRVELILARVVIGEFEFDLLDPRVLK